MSLQESSFRKAFWSSLCDTNLSAYSQYLKCCEVFAGDGVRFLKAGGVDGVGKLAICDGGCVDAVYCPVVAGRGDGVDTSDTVVGCVESSGGAVGAQDNFHSGSCQGHMGGAFGGVSGVSLGGGCGVVFDDRVVSGVSSLRESGGVVDSSSDGGSVGATTTEVLVSDERKARGRHYASNRRKKDKKREKRSEKEEAMRRNWREGRTGATVSEVKKSDSAYGSGGSVCTVDTRTGVEIEAAQTLAACRVAENRKREVEAKVAAKLAEHRLAALHDKDRTVAVQRLAAARYEQKINEAKAKSQASYKKCDESMKSLGSTGSAGEFALKQAVKEAKDNAITLKYVQEQAEFLLQHVTPEIRQRVAEMPEPEYEDEFEVFGDCPSDYDEEQREAYYDDLNRRNANHGLVGSSPAPPRRELTPEEFLKIEEEIRALSANQV